MKLGRRWRNTQVFSLTYDFTRVMSPCDCACNREADTAGLEPAPSHCADTVVDTGALPIRAICPVILFWATSWANHPRGGQTPFADRGGQWFRGRTNLDCQAKDYQWSLRGRSFRPVAAFSTACFSIRTAYKRSRVGLGAPYLTASS